MSEIIVALDNLTYDQSMILASKLQGRVWGFKINDLLVEYGVNIISALKVYGKVFVDPKLHDIPNTVSNSVKRLAKVADMITVHIAGGVEMLKAAKKAAGKSKIIGVSMLTSLNFDDVRAIYRGYPLERWADMVDQANLHGVVCSGKDLPFWSLFNLIKVVPGVRPNGRLQQDDQKNICSFVDAEYLVIGRPIVNAPDPVAAVEMAKDVIRAGGR